MHDIYKAAQSTCLDAEIGKCTKLRLQDQNFMLDVGCIRLEKEISGFKDPIHGTC